MPQVVQFNPMAGQTIPVQVPITTGNGQTVYQTVHVPLQAFAQSMPGLCQPQMQIIPQMTQQVANIITPNGQIQQVHLTSMNPLAQLQAAQQQAQQQQQQQQNVILQQAQMQQSNPVTSNQNIVPATSVQNGQNSQESKPITITGAQGQQITVIPTQAFQQIRPNSNIIQMPTNISGLQSIPVQNIAGLGNVQVNSFYYFKLSFENIFFFL